MSWRKGLLVFCSVFCLAITLEVCEASAGQPVSLPEQAEKLFHDGKYIEVVELVGDSDSPELLFLQFRAEFEIGRSSDLDATFPGSKTAKFLKYVRGHEADFDFSEALSGYMLSNERNEYFLKQLSTLDASRGYVNAVKLQILNQQFDSAAEGGYVMNKRERGGMEVFKKRYQELDGAAGVDRDEIKKKIDLIEEAIAEFDRQQVQQHKVE